MESPFSFCSGSCHCLSSFARTCSKLREDRARRRDFHPWGGHSLQNAKGRLRDSLVHHRQLTVQARKLSTELPAEEGREAAGAAGSP